ESHCSRIDCSVRFPYESLFRLILFMLTVYNLPHTFVSSRGASMRRFLLAALITLIALLPLSASNSDDEALFGFAAATSHTERDWENKFRAIPDPKNLRDYMQKL